MFQYELQQDYAPAWNFLISYYLPEVFGYWYLNKNLQKKREYLVKIDLHSEFLK